MGWWFVWNCIIIVKLDLRSLRWDGISKKCDWLMLTSDWKLEKSNLRLNKKEWKFKIKDRKSRNQLWNFKELSL